MKLIHDILDFLRKPFPEDESRFGALKTLTIISLFISLFLYIFGPFGISDLDSDKFLICLGFGSMTFFASIIYQIIINQLFGLRATREAWTYWKWMVFNFGLVFFISLANFIFARLVLFGFIDWRLFPVMIYGTFMVGLIPTMALGAWSLLSQERKYKGIAKEINRQERGKKSSVSSYKELVFDVPIYQIRYIEALQNYIKIGFIDDHGKYNSKVERSTLKQTLKDTKDSRIVKCHRSFLVNLDAIVSTKGNAPGHLLEALLFLRPFVI
ncbi:MAG: LytTR family DNA-binding domain-containing protein [Saprospiraceae bacterium]|nr:LytTR family DNA-binding domain-containing protein [Saprospiraceae bacterium]